VLFAPESDQESAPRTFAPDAWLLKGRATAIAEALIGDLERVVSVSPWRRVMTPGGKPMSVDMTNCGARGWVSDRRGYRYESVDPLTTKPWPTMPDAFRDLARDAAAEAGFAGFDPDACLVNQYARGAKMALHQDRDERDMTQPIVSVSLGLPIAFMFGGPRRSDPTTRIMLEHGDVVVWGASSRLFFHGVGTLRAGLHPLTGASRINLTFRRAA
jgi:alkylated DNA repair protein (DNA oxidative demethylase)